MTPIDPWLLELEKELRERRESHRLRSLNPAPTGIDFSSNDYLSLNRDGVLAEFLERLQPITDVGSTGSRLIRGHRPAFDRAEQAFAEWSGTESALLFHSGYAANIATLQALLGPRDQVFVDRLCHASILDGIRMSGARRHYFQHNDLNHLEATIKKAGGRSDRGRRWILSEGVFSMDGDSPNRDELLALARNRDCLVFLDEAHSIGIEGDGGRGLASPRQREFAVLSYPMGKAPGLMGCFVAGSGILREYLVNHARGFIYSTAQPPFLADLLHLVIQSMPEAEMEARRQRLRERCILLHGLLREEGFQTPARPSHIVPVPLGSEEKTLRTAAFLEQKGFSVFPIRPPSVPAGHSRLRLCVHAGNTETEIRSLVEQLVLSRSGG